MNIHYDEGRASKRHKTTNYRFHTLTHSEQLLFDIRRQNHEAPGVSLPPPYVSELDVSVRDNRCAPVFLLTTAYSQTDAVYIADWKNPPSTRMMKREDGQTFEVVVRAIGVLCGANLPPVSASG